LFDHIKIEGFRSFKSVELDLSPLSVLIGPNNGGKSNLLDLMSLMAEAAQGGLGKGIDSRGGFIGVGFGFYALHEIQVQFRFQAKSLRPIFPAFVGAPRSDVCFKLGLGLRFEPFATEVKIEEVAEEPAPQRARAIPLVRRDKDGCAFRSVDAHTGAETEERKSLESGSELAIFQIKDFQKYPTPYKVLRQFQEWALYADINVRRDAPVRLPALVRPTARLEPDGANLAPVLNSIQQMYPEAWDEILEIVRAALPDFKAITFPPGGGDGKVMLRWWESPFDKEGVSANFLSDGTLKLLCLVAILKSPDPPPLICIDEPEIGLHPDWIEIVAEMMQSAAGRTQLIVATHSPQIVAKLDPEQVIVTEKENGETHLRRLERHELEKWLKEFNLSELWLAGHFGGRP